MLRVVNTAVWGEEEAFGSLRDELRDILEGRTGKKRKGRKLSDMAQGLAEMGGKVTYG